MKIETAKKVLEKQAEFFGWSVYDLMMYSKKVVEAYEVLSWNRYENA